MVNVPNVSSGLSDSAMNQMGMDQKLTGIEENIPLRPLAMFGNPVQQQPYHPSYKVVE